MKYIEKDDKRALIIYVFLSFLFILPIMQAGVYYRDDLDRSITGFYGWAGLGRPLADLLMQIVTASGLQLIDTTPYTTILSALCVALSAFYLRDHISKKGIIGATFISSLVIFNPFFLQNLSYRFDSLPMSLALLLSFISYCFEHKSTPLKYFVRLASGVSALSLYQPCFNIFIALLAIDSACHMTKSESGTRSIIVTAINKALEFTVIYVFYYTTVAQLYLVGNSRANMISFDSNGYAKLESTITRLKYMIEDVIHGPALNYFKIAFLFSAISVIALLVMRRATLVKLIVGAIVAISALILSLQGPTYLLVDSPVLPRAVVSISVPLVIMAIFCSSWIYLLRYAAIFPAIPFMAFSAHLGNALSDQRKYEDGIFDMIAYDIANKSMDGYSMVKIVGTPAFSPRSKNILREHPGIKHFLSASGGFQASFILDSKGIKRVQTSYGTEQKNSKLLHEVSNDPTKVISKNDLYSIYRVDDALLVDIGR